MIRDASSTEVGAGTVLIGKVSTARRTTSTKKEVTFAARHKTNVFYKVDRATSDEDSLWWSMTHIRRNKKMLDEEGKKWQAKGYGIILKDVFANPTGCREKLDTFVQLPGDDYMRGAENWLCPVLQRERMEAKKCLIQTIIDTEIAARIAGAMSPAEMEEKLATLSRELSSQACNFAKRMGMADELGDKLGENPELPFYILSNGGKTSTSSFLDFFPIKESLPPTVGISIGRLVNSVAMAMGA